MSLLAKMKGLRRYCGVEPVVFFYSYWYFLGLLAVLQYVYYRFSEDKGFPYRNLTESGEGCGDGGGFPLNSSLHQLEIEVQSASSELYLYYLGVWALSISFIVPFTGSYTDRRGRKPGLIAPLVGAILETLVLLLVLYLELPVYVLIVGGLVNGLTGNEATMMMATTCYVTDTTDDKQKAFRLSPAVGILGGMLNPVLWEKMSTIVGREEQGSLFATIAVIQTLMELTGTLLFNTIYPESLRFGIPGFVFFLSSAIMLIPFAILSCIHFPEGHATKKKLEHVEDVEFQELSTHL
ncbi:proton-coupled folate transporter isoform X2 [Nematostella vectensis]|uniref:proton-coupled folate transporter isoform X2 n=1 Tax=Nematostella vectensis TaxID=45351 RepID=UPI002076E965|nr:proton-coupled folate transporter isoform X2 [Nematostella vectensis]